MNWTSYLQSWCWRQIEVRTAGTELCHLDGNPLLMCQKTKNNNNQWLSDFQFRYLKGVGSHLVFNRGRYLSLAVFVQNCHYKLYSAVITPRVINQLTLANLHKHMWCGVNNSLWASFRSGRCPSCPSVVIFSFVTLKHNSPNKLQHKRHKERHLYQILPLLASAATKTRTLKLLRHLTVFNLLHNAFNFHRHDSESGHFS